MAAEPSYAVEVANRGSRTYVLENQDAGALLAERGDLDTAIRIESAGHELTQTLGMPTLSVTTLPATTH